jgi:hypothetical protein
MTGAAAMSYIRFTSHSVLGALARWQRRAGCLLTCGLVSIASVASPASADAAFRTWKPFTADNLWSNPANWEEGVAPVDGDDLRFPTPAVTPATVVNDIPNLEVHTLATTGDFTITGQPFTLTNSLFGTGTATYDVHITLRGDQIWTMHGYHVVLNQGVELNGKLHIVRSGRLAGGLRIPGVVSGTGSLFNDGAVLELLNANTYSGPTFGGASIGHAQSLGVGDGTFANGFSGGGLTLLSPGIVLGDERIETTSILSQVGGATFNGPIKLLGDDPTAFLTGLLDLNGSIEFAGTLLSRPQTLTTSAIDVAGADLVLVLPEGFQTTMGQTFTLVRVSDATPIAGTFNGLPEGATFTSSGVRFAISYVGGDGNDIVLTVVGLDKQYYLSEGATGAFFSTDILLANPNATAAPVTVTFLKSGGGPPVVVSQDLPAWSRRTIRVDDLDGMENTSFSTIVRSNDGLPIVVERTMAWDQTGYGSHTERAVEGPSKTWYFAEGSQGFFSTYVLLSNPHPDANTATVQYLLEGESAITRTYQLEPESRFTVDVGADVELRGKTFGMTVTFEQPAIAERAMYFGASPLWTGGHESAGVTAPSTSWFLAEGATGTFFETFILLANPNPIDVTATVRFLPAGGSAVTKTKVIPANGRVTLNIEQEDASLASVAVATTVTTLLPIIVERSQYWPDPAPQWQEAHNSFGQTTLGTKWGLAEGRVGGPDNAQTYILVAFPKSNHSVKMTFLRETGVPVQKTFSTSGVGGRLNVAVGGPDVPEITNERFGVLIESTDPIAVERALYWDAGGVTWAAGSNATATRLP